MVVFDRKLFNKNVRIELRIVNIKFMRSAWGFLQKYLLFMLPLAILAPGITDFLYPGSGSPYTDILISHYPNALNLIDSINRWHSIPLWSDNILGGYPFIANPLSGTWYPLGYLAYLFQLPFGFNLMMGLHLVFGGIGVYKLLREEGASEQAAQFGGVIFSVMPKFFAHIGAGHLSLIYAISWTGWVLAVERIGTKTRTTTVRKYLPGVFMGMIFLADPRWVPYAGVMWLGYKIAHRHNEHIWICLGEVITNGMSFMIVTAPVLLPFIEFIQHSTRASLANDESLIHSLPPSVLLGIIIPDPQSYHEWTTYLGGAVFILSVCIVMTYFRNHRITFWSIAFFTSLILALGIYFPLNKFIVELPGVNLLRVPARALFITGMSACILAAHGLDLLLDKEHLRTLHLIHISVFGICVFSILLLIGILFVSRSFESKIIWGLASLMAGSLWINVWLYYHLDNRVWIWGMILLVLVDWGIFSRLSYIPKQPIEAFRETEKVAKHLAEKSILFRTYSPSYSLPQQTAAKFSLQLSDGIDPLQLSTYVDYMVIASGVPRSEYSVTVPEFANGDPSSDNRGYSPDAVQLGKLNVAYILSEYDLRSSDLLLETRFGDTRVYKNLKARPRAWMQQTLENASAEWWEVESIEWRPNQIEITAEGPGVLILSEIAYPGWKVTVDGECRQIMTPDGLLRGVYIDPGRHRVIFTYRPVSLYFGIIVSLIGILGLLGFRLSAARKARVEYYID